jgi:DMSO/TMAO reductase YedYZ molybdopterin-dependent catalytic subunit
MSSDNQSKQKLPPGQRAIKRLLRWGTDHPGIALVSPKIALDTYMLTIEREVKNPVRLNWKEVLALPKTVSVSDFHCVEGWSVLDCRWEGVRFRDIEKLVKPLDTARKSLLNAQMPTRLRYCERNLQTKTCFWRTG